MKKFLIGLVLGSFIFGATGKYVCIGYEEIILRKEQKIFELENELKSMEYTIRDLKAENDFLSK